MFAKNFIVIEHELLRLNCKLFIEIFVCIFTFASIIDLLDLILLVADLQMNLFEQSLKKLALMLEDYLFSLKSLDKEFVYLRWSFNYLILSQKASSIYNRINNLLRYLFILKLSYDGKFVYFIIEIKDKWKFY